LRPDDVALRVVDLEDERLARVSEEGRRRHGKVRRNIR
jgi:hypothetical protein